MTRASFILSLLLGSVCIINYCFCDIEHADLLKSYKEYFNKQNSDFTYEDGIINNVEKLANLYNIKITIKVKEQANPQSFRLLRCTATVNDDAGILTVVENQCNDGTIAGRSANEAADVSSELDYVQDVTTEFSTTESDVGRQAVNLDSEVQADNAQINSSGEQFVAIPRPQFSSPCIGCTSLVDNAALGVDVLAYLAVRHINKHTPDIAYKLKSVVQVERQVQIVNGVRYILTIDVSPSNCVQTEVENCSGVKICKVSILEKPWLKMPDGKKFRAVLSNNCTKQWLFGEDGEALSTKDDDVINSDDDVMKASKIVDVQAIPNAHNKLTEEELKELEEQIIPTNEIERHKRDANGVEEVLNPNSLILLNLAIKAFDKYSLEKGLRINVVYATKQLMSSYSITRIDFNVIVLEPRPIDKTYEVSKRCHTRVLEHDKSEKSFDTHCALMEDGLDRAIEIPASNPKWRPVTRERLHNEYGELLQIDEIIRVYDSVIFDSINIIFIARSRVNNAYRCHLIIKGNTKVPIVCKVIELSPVKKVEKNPNDLKYLHLASEALKKYLISSNISEPYIVAVVLHASEVDSPLTYVNIDFIAVDFLDTLRCIAQIQESKKSDITKISVNCSKIMRIEDYPPEVIIKRNPLDQKYSQIAREALKNRLDYSNESLQIVYANEQVVRGVINRLDLDVKEAKNEKIYRCHVKLYEKPSDNIRELKIDCFPKALNFIGGGFEQIASNPKNWVYAKESLVKKYNSSLSLLEVIRVTTVNGFAESDFYAISDSDKVLHICHASNLVQPLGNVSHLKVECKPINAKPLPGKIVEQDPSDPKYKAIAIKALAKEPWGYLNESLRIVYVNEQLVTGVITRLDFDVKEIKNATVLRCHVRLYEKPRKHARELKIDCFPKDVNLSVGQTEQNASDPRNWHDARRSLAKQFGDSLFLIEVLRVTTRAVNGGINESDFDAISEPNNIVYRCHNTIFLNLVYHFRDTELSCHPILHKQIYSKITGGKEKRDPSDPKFLELAKKSLSQFITTANSSKPYRVALVTHATEQVTVGLSTDIHFIAVLDNNRDLLKCFSNIFDSFLENSTVIKVNCSSTLPTPRSKRMVGGKQNRDPTNPKYLILAKKALSQYLNTESVETQFKITIEEVTTQVVAGLSTDINFTAIAVDDSNGIKCHSNIWEKGWVNSMIISVDCNQIRKKRHDKKLGGKIQQDPNNPKYLSLAGQSLLKYLKLEDVSNHKITIEKVTTQVVAGIITEIDFITISQDSSSGYKCHSSIFERSWENIMNINVNCDPLETAGRKKRESDIRGGITPQDPNNPEYLTLAGQSLRKYLKLEDVSNHKITIEKVTTQVVAGIITEIDFITISQDSSSGYKCHSRIYERYWENYMNINVNCDPLETAGRKKREYVMPGGKATQDPNGPEYLKLAGQSLRKYLKLEDVSNHKITVEKVTTQVVAGIITEIDFITISQDSSSGYKCHSSIYERKWEKFMDIDVNCAPLETAGRKKREYVMPGGKATQDPNGPEYLKLAGQSLRKYLKLEDVSNHKITVEKVTTQVVAGIITEIDFITISQDGSSGYKCHSSIYERYWENYMDINVNCDPLETAGRKKREYVMPGGKATQDPNGPEYLKLAGQSLRKYLKLEDVSNHKITVEKVTTQVVAGIITEIDFITISQDSSSGYKCHSSIYERKWEKFMDINVNCDPLETAGRKKREYVMPGGKATQDPNGPEYLKLAGQSLRKYLKLEDVSNHKITVEKVTTQVVAGIITEIDFITISQDSSSGYKCHSSIYERYWENYMDINVNCDPLETAGRKKREYVMPGGKATQDPNGPEYLKLAGQSLRKYLKLEDVSNHKITVEKVTTQVVAGIITEIDFITISQDSSSGYKCHSSIYERKWEKFMDINVNCDPLETAGRKKREYVMPGGKATQDPNGPEYLKLAGQSLRKYLKLEDVSNHKITVEKVTTQVVAGIITEIDFITISQDSSSGYKCHSSIYERKWEKFMDINVNCDPLETAGRKKREYVMPGGKATQDPNGPEYLKLAGQSLRKYLKLEDVSNHKITVEKVTTQVVAGIITEIDFITISQDSSSGYKCHSSIYERYWENYMNINVNCDPLETAGRKKRESDITGGITPQDPNNPEYLTLAGQSLRKYLKLEDVSNHKITIEKVTTQVVAGIITEIDFITISQDSSSGYKCHSSIYERKWEKFMDINVNCDPLSGRKKREMVGDKTPQDPNDPKYFTLARQSFSQYLEGRDAGNHQISVEKVTTQVVAGLSTEIDFTAKNNSGGYMCHSNILESSSKRSITINVDCSPFVSRKKRDSKLVGRNTSPDPNDPEIVSLAKLAFNKFLRLKGKPITEYLITIEKVTQPKFLGKMTQIEFKAEAPDYSGSYKCESSLWERPWENNTIIRVQCTPLEIVSRKKRGIEEAIRDLTNKRSSGSTKILNDEIHYLESINKGDLIKADHFANEALKHIDAKYRHPRQMKVVSIFSFAKDPKEHNLAHYRIKMEVGYTNCLALSPTVEACSLVTDMGPNKFCRVSIWLQPDRDHPPRFQVSCDINENQIEINKKAQAEQLFFYFLSEHKPAYLNKFEEMKRRLEVFEQNIEKIHELNTYERGTARYGVTKFSDLTDEEFNSKHLGLKPHLDKSNSMTMTKAVIPNVTLPESFDWREKGAVTEVKNQGVCGSCWAFSVTGNIEGQWKLKSGQLVSLSEQELVDCDTLDDGCAGGLPTNAYRSIQKLGGLETEQDYPYDMKTETCTFNKSLAKVQISGAVNITSDETSMAQWMVEHGPISIGINANGMQFYVGGVSHPWKALCNPDNLDHGVLIVGFGTDKFPVLHKKSLPYWIIKNSWGPYWGEQGYYRIYRGDGSCGVNQMASSAVIN